MKIHDWLRVTFDYPGPKLFLELGAHHGEDTIILAAIPGATVHAFEPDPRNSVPYLPNVHFHRLAVAARCGPMRFLLSNGLGGRSYTKSSSIKRPTGHLAKHPDVTFGNEIDVDATTLDTFALAWSIGTVDFIWADVQGAEREMILGGQELLARTRYLYTEYSDVELYEGQPMLAEILAMLPRFLPLMIWPDDVLLANRDLVEP